MGHIRILDLDIVYIGNLSASVTSFGPSVTSMLLKESYFVYTYLFSSENYIPLKGGSLFYSSRRRKHLKMCALDFLSSDSAKIPKCKLFDHKD